MMSGRTSLLERKKLQWAREREEMARLGGSWGPLKQNNVRTTIRTYPAGSRVSLTEIRDKHGPSQPFRAGGHYGSSVSLRSLATECSGNTAANLKGLEFTSGSLINLADQTEVAQMRRRSPSLPPIYNRESHQYPSQDQRDFNVDSLKYQQRKSEKQQERRYPSNEGSDEGRKEGNQHYGSPAEERGGETSGYASDSIEAPLPPGQRLLPECKAAPSSETTEKTWQNPYYTTPESSLPPSRRLSAGRIGELNRPRWGSLWGQDVARGDPPAPSWLARLGHSSQVLVINHDSASSPDSSTTGSTGSDTNKTYLRGQNIPVDADILLEREAKRQKALELQNAIKRQLEEKDKQRKEEKERQMREERLEEERIRRDRDKEKERFEEEQKRLREKEDAKFRQAEAMKEVLEAAERLAKEEKRNRRKVREVCEESSANPASQRSENSSQNSVALADKTNELGCPQSEPQNLKDSKDSSNQRQLENDKEKLNTARVEDLPKDCNSVQVPISKDVAIVLSGRLEDPEILTKANLQLVNLVMTPSPRLCENSHGITLGLNAIIRNQATDSPLFLRNAARSSPRIVENRLLTPSKYRAPSGRDFGTQTDIESDLQDVEEKAQESAGKDNSTKDRKDTTNASRRDEKGNHTDDMSLKPIPRSKSQPRTTLDSRPRWNANRPGTRYRTQSEKDPHYQRRLRLRRRQVESSDDGSRSPSPDRRKVNVQKSKIRNSTRRKMKLDSYDADLSMDSLNSVIPLRVDKNGRITLDDSKNRRKDRVNEIERIEKSEESSNVWCGQEILSKLSSLRDGLLMKQLEWDPDRCIVSPAASEIF